MIKKLSSVLVLVLVLVLILIPSQSYYQTLFTQNNSNKTSSAFKKHIDTSHSNKSNHLQIKYDTGWGGGAGIKSVHVSKSGKIAVACDLEGCSVWILNLSNIS